MSQASNSVDHSGKSLSPNKDDAHEDEYEDDFENEPQSEHAIELSSSRPQQPAAPQRATSAVSSKRSSSAFSSSSSSSTSTSTSTSSTPSTSSALPTSVAPRATAAPKQTTAQRAPVSVPASEGVTHSRKDANNNRKTDKEDGRSSSRAPARETGGAVSQTSSRQDGPLGNVAVPTSRSAAAVDASLPEQQGASSSRNIGSKSNVNNSSFASSASSSHHTAASRLEREDDHPRSRSRASAHALRQQRLGQAPRATSVLSSRRHSHGATPHGKKDAANHAGAGGGAPRLIVKHQPQISALTLAQLRSENADLEREWRQYDGEVVDLLFLMARAAERITAERARLKEVRARRAALEQRDRRAAHTIARLTRRVSTLAEDERQLSTRGYYDQAQMHLRVREARRRLEEAQRGCAVVEERANELEERVRKRRLARITAKEWARLRQRYSENANRLTQLRGAVELYRGQSSRRASRSSAGNALQLPAYDRGEDDVRGGMSEKTRRTGALVLPAVTPEQKHRQQQQRNRRVSETPPPVRQSNRPPSSHAVQRTTMSQPMERSELGRGEATKNPDDVSLVTSTPTNATASAAITTGMRDRVTEEETTAVTRNRYTTVAAVSTPVVDASSRGVAESQAKQPSQHTSLAPQSSSAAPTAESVPVTRPTHRAGEEGGQSSQTTTTTAATNGRVVPLTKVEEELSSVESAAETATSGRTTPMWLR